MTLIDHKENTNIEKEQIHGREHNGRERNR